MRLRGGDEESMRGVGGDVESMRSQITAFSYITSIMFALLLYINERCGVSNYKLFIL